MTRTFGTLVNRELARLSSGRVFVFGGLIALVLLAASATIIAVRVGAQSTELSTQLLAIRVVGYEQTQSYSVLLLALAAVLGLDQISGDIRSRTIFAILAKPIQRGQLLLAGWVASALFLLVLEFIRGASCLGPSMWSEGRLAAAPLAGGVAVLAGHWLTLAEFTAFGAVLPPAYAGLAGIANLMIGGSAFARTAEGPGMAVVDAIARFLPLPSLQQRVIDGAIDGSSTLVGPVIEVILYRLCWAALFLTIGVYVFNRRDIAPRM